MAKYATHFKGNFKEVIELIKKETVNGSFTANLEDESYVTLNEVECSVLVFERYSYTGGNRVSLSITVLGYQDDIQVIGVTSGGSQAVFFKFNTFGEEAFLEHLEKTVTNYKQRTSE